MQRAGQSALMFLTLSLPSPRAAQSGTPRTELEPRRELTPDTAAAIGKYASPTVLTKSAVSAKAPMTMAASFARGMFLTSSPAHAPPVGFLSPRTRARMFAAVGAGLEAAPEGESIVCCVAASEKRNGWSGADRGRTGSQNESEVEHY